MPPGWLFGVLGEALAIVAVLAADRADELTLAAGDPAERLSLLPYSTVGAAAAVYVAFVEAGGGAAGKGDSIPGVSYHFVRLLAVSDSAGSLGVHGCGFCRRAVRGELFSGACSRSGCPRRRPLLVRCPSPAFSQHEDSWDSQSRPL